MSTRTEDGGAGTGGEPQQAGGKPRWSRRRVLGWGLGLLPAVAAGGWAAFEWLGEYRDRARRAASAVSLTRESAPYLFTGIPGAGLRLNAAIGADEAYVPARLLRACLFLDQENRPDLAREDLSVPGLRETPEGRLLWELLERRPKAPSWRQAFLDSWRAVGSPDFRESTLLPAPLPDNLLFGTYSLAYEQAEEVQERFALAVRGLNEDNWAWVLGHVPTMDSIPLLMALRETLTAPEVHGPWAPALRDAVEERLGQLTGPSPRTLQLALHAFLKGSTPTTPFTRRDLEVLETLVALPEWKQPSSEQFFLETRKHFQRLRWAQGYQSWLLMVWAQGLSLARCLLDRVKASKAHLGEDEQRWMGRLLWEAGARLRAQRSYFEVDTGLRLQVYGSELTGHSETRMECISFFLELGRWEDAVKQSGLARWPLAALQEEAYEARARDELALLKAFAGQGALP